MPQDAGGDTRMQIGTISNVDTALKRHAGVGGHRVGGAQLLQLGRKYARESPRALCKEFVHVDRYQLEGFNDDEDDDTN